ncbi:DBIRD complex subunit ZNF326 [Merluccius polli]|uniref:DBIRD complex subunit ZNF326 n=1 Tax=Merluccius polli TaxID=89951 RepID=A0AA47MC00_MERPO|nr:DBIRD complex subunit ZNF326 [Merluccius polli]
MASMVVFVGERFRLHGSEISACHVVDLYDPYDQLSSESESEMGQAKRCDRRSPMKDVDHRGHREMAHSQPEETHAEWRDRSAVRRDRSAARRDRSPSDRRPKHRSLSPRGSQHRPATSPGVPRTYDQLCYNPVRPNERSSPETHSLGEERVTGPPLNTEFATSVGLSTPNFPVDYRLQTGYCETGVSSVNMAPPREVAVSSRAIAVKDIEQQSAFSCELCEVEYARLEELQEHLESSSHWDTMEHIQKLNNYDDLTIAFLQEVMMFKVRQCCRAMVDQDFEALKETDHMTRVDMLHCAVCNVYISTSATSVKNHVSSMKHHHNKQSFCYRQKHQCLDKAAVMINLLKPQFEQYREGGNPFE